jgi:tRNA threonylcarbamoyl adenosine modification protein YeaZ
VNVLAIDTSSGISVAYVTSDGRRIEKALDAQNQHGELTVQMIHDVLVQAEALPEDVTDIVVGVGPGPYTGLRVGIACAIVFGFARNIPVHGICSLDAVAHDFGEPCVVVTNARRKELYWAQYADGRVGEPQVSLPNDLAAACPNAQFVGPGADLYPDVISGQVLGLRAAALADLFLSGTAQLVPVTPMYLRAPDAAEPGKPKSVLL